MKMTRMFLMAALAATLALAGCSKSSSVDTSGLEKNFSTAEPATKSAADQAATTIKSGDYPGAMAQLQSLANKAKLTPEQQQAVKDVMAQVQKVIADAASKAAGEASKAAGDLQKSLKK
jgi:hypothetical protein